MTLKTVREVSTSSNRLMPVLGGLGAFRWIKESPHQLVTAVAFIRREIVTGLQAWFEQTDTTLKAEAAEDADEVVKKKTTRTTMTATMTATTIASMQCDAQEDDDDERKLLPNIKVPPPTRGLTSFEPISIRLGMIAKKSSTETQDTPDKSSPASNGHPSLSGSNGRPLTRSGCNDARNYTTKRTGF
jgi:hypothetical protein